MQIHSSNDPHWAHDLLNVRADLLWTNDGGEWSCYLHGRPEIQEDDVCKLSAVCRRLWGGGKSKHGMGAGHCRPR